MIMQGKFGNQYNMPEQMRHPIILPKDSRISVISNQMEQQLFIKPKQPIIAVDEDLTLYSVYTKEEIHHDC